MPDDLRTPGGGTERCACGELGAGLGPGTGLPGRLLGDDTHVSAETCRRIACDASLVLMVRGKVASAEVNAPNGVLDVGRRRRTVPPALRRALEAHDGGCRFPGCGVSLRWCDAHHVLHWADGGATKLDNLVLLCSVHHRALHEEGNAVTLTEGGATQFRRTDGGVIPEVPAAPSVPDDPVGSFAAEHEKMGIEVTPWSSTPSWLGEPFDLDWALGALWAPREVAASDLS